MKKKLKGNRQAVTGVGNGLPLNMMVEVTNACNHQCIFCAHSKMRRRARMMDLGVFEDIARQAYSGGTREIGFYMTGEPLLHRNLEAFVALSRTIGFNYIYITTNGALATLERLEALIAAGVNSIKFSINAGTRETYERVHGRDDFVQVKSNLLAVSDYIRRNGLDVGLFVSYIICRQNQHEVEAFRREIERHVDEFRAMPAYNQGGNMAELKDGVMLDPEWKPQNAPCSMLFNRLHVTCEGLLTACCVDFDEELVVADLKETPLPEAWNCDRMRQLREQHLNNTLPESSMCWRCINNM